MPVSEKRKDNSGHRTPPKPLVFLNIPYDRKFRKLALAYIAAICASGLRPRATLEIAGSTRRLDKIYALIGKCEYSIHDLSRVEVDRAAPRVPRFNMPFELGLAVAWALESGKKHKWFVFESVNYRVSKSLSDVNGTDAYIHEAEVDGVFRQIRNAFPRSRYRPTVENMKLIYDALVAQAGRKDIFQSAEFSDLVYAAMGLVQRMRERKEIKAHPVIPAPLSMGRAKQTRSAS